MSEKPDLGPTRLGLRESCLNSQAFRCAPLYTLWLDLFAGFGSPAATRELIQLLIKDAPSRTPRVRAHTPETVIETVQALAQQSHHLHAKFMVAIE